MAKKKIENNTTPPYLHFQSLSTTIRKPAKNSVQGTDEHDTITYNHCHILNNCTKFYKLRYSKYWNNRFLSFKFETAMGYGEGAGPQVSRMDEKLYRRTVLYGNFAHKQVINPFHTISNWSLWKKKQKIQNGKIRTILFCILIAAIVWCFQQKIVHKSKVFFCSSFGCVLLID